MATAKQAKPTSMFDEIRADIISWLDSEFLSHLKPPSTRVFHEILYAGSQVHGEYLFCTLAFVITKAFIDNFYVQRIGISSLGYAVKSSPSRGLLSAKRFPTRQLTWDAAAVLPAVRRRLCFRPCRTCASPISFTRNVAV